MDPEWMGPSTRPDPHSPVLASAGGVSAGSGSRGRRSALLAVSAALLIAVVGVVYLTVRADSSAHEMAFLLYQKLFGNFRVRPKALTFDDRSHFLWMLSLPDVAQLVVDK